MANETKLNVMDDGVLFAEVEFDKAKYYQVLIPARVAKKPYTLKRLTGRDEGKYEVRKNHVLATVALKLGNGAQFRGNYLFPATITEQTNMRKAALKAGLKLKDTAVSRTELTLEALQRGSQEIDETQFDVDSLVNGATTND